MTDPWAGIPDPWAGIPDADTDPWAGIPSADKPERLPWWKEMLLGGGSRTAGLAQAMGRASDTVARAITPDVLETQAFDENRRLFRETFTDNAQLLAEGLAPPDQRPFLERLRDRKITTLLRTGAEAVPSLIPVVAGGAVAGPPGAMAVGAAVGFTTSAQDAYDEAIARGNDERTSMAIGGSVGALSAVLEGWAATALFKPLKTAFGRSMTQRVARGETSKIIREVFSGAAREGATEGLQELASAAGELMAGKPLAEVLEHLDDRIAQAVTGGLVLGGATGSVALVQERRTNTRAERNAAHRLLDDARDMEPEALREFIPPRIPGEWAMQALPTGDWTTESLRSAHEHLDNVALPDVLEKVPDHGVREVRAGIKRSAAWLGSEVPFVNIVREGFGDKVGDQLQDMFSFTRRASTAGRTILNAEVRSMENERIAPAYKDILALVSPIQASPIADPTNGKWLAQYAGQRDRKGNPKLDKTGTRKLPDYMVSSPGMRYLEEARWTLRMVDLKDRKLEFADRMQQLGAATKAVGQSIDGLKSQPRGPEVDAEMQQLVEQRKALDDELATVTKEHDAIAYSHDAMQDSESRLAWLKQHPQWGIIEMAAEAAAQWDQHMVTMLADAEIISRDQEQRILARGGHYAGFFVATPNAMPSNLRERLAAGPEEPGRVKVGLRRDVPLMLPSESSLFRAATVSRDVHAQLNRNNLLKLVEAAPEWWAEAGVSLDPIEGVHRPDLHVRAMRDGEKVPIYMPKELLLAFESLTPVQSDVVTEGIKSYFRTWANLSRAIHLLTPTFAVGQVFRDQIEAGLFASEIGYRPYVDMARGMIHMFTNSREAQDFRQFGGGMGSIASLDVDAAQDMLDDVALRAREEDVRSTAQLAATRLLRIKNAWWRREVKHAKAERIPAGVFYPLARLLETLDTSTRVGAYVRALEKGRSEAEGLAISRRVAIDFARGGETTNNWSSYLPFVGARAQGFALNREAVRRAGRAATAAGATNVDRGVVISKAMALGAGAATVMPLWYLVVLPELVHFALHADDDDYFRDTEDWERARYYHWLQMDDGEWTKTPRPLGYLSKLFGYGLGQALNVAYRDEPRTLQNVLATLQDDIPGAAEFPLGFGVAQPNVIADDAGDFGLRTGWIPPGLEPALMIATGRTPWQQRLIVPEWQGERLPPRQHGFRTTPAVYVDLARIIPGNAEEAMWAATHPGEQASRTANWLTGGKIGSEERFSSTAETSTKLTSPLWLEQVGLQVAGSVGSEMRRVPRLVDALLGEDVPLSEIPVVRNFFQRSKDSPQMWRVRRMLELALEGKRYMEVKRKRGEGLTSAESKAYEQLQEKAAGGLLSAAEEKRFAALEEKALAPTAAEIGTMRTWQMLARRAQDVRELLTSWHEARRAGDDALMQQLDAQILEIATTALEEYGEIGYDESGLPLGSGKRQLGEAGRGWAARFYRRLRAP